MPYVEIGSDGTLRGVQEGRHRTVAAENAGLDTIPVRILYNESREGEGGGSFMSARSDGGRMESIRSQIDEAVVGAVPPEDTFSTEGEAQDRAGEIGCTGAHQMPDGNWMPCDTHGEYHDAKGIESKVSEIENQIEASIGQEINDREFGLVLPKTDNSGQKIKPEIIEDIAHVITQRFGGVTVHPSVAGCFIPDEGEMEGELMCEENVLVTTIRDSEDAVPFPEDADFLRNIGEEVGRDLGQISVLVTEDRMEVEFVGGEYREELPDHMVEPGSVFRSLL